MDRRKYPRLIGPFSANWKSSTGQVRPCRVSDLSLGGCFVSSRTAPRPGETVEVVIESDGTEPVTLAGSVKYGEWSDGFGVEFRAMSVEQIQELKALMGRLRTRRKTA